MTKVSEFKKEKLLEEEEDLYKKVEDLINENTVFMFGLELPAPGRQ